MPFLSPAISLTVINLVTLLLLVWFGNSAPNTFHSQLVPPATIVVVIIGFISNALFWKFFADQRKKSQSALLRLGRELANFPGFFPATIFITLQVLVGSLLSGLFALHAAAQMTKFLPVIFWALLTSLVLTIWLTILFVPRLKLLTQSIKPSGQALIGWLIGICLAGYYGMQVQKNIHIFTDQNFILKYQNWINWSTTVLFPLITIDLLVIFALFYSFQQQKIRSSTKVNEPRQKIDRELSKLETWFATKLRFVLYPAILAFLITGGFFVVFLMFFRITYGSSVDDLNMISLLSGYGGNAPTAYIIYMNYLLAYPLMLLYQLHTNINWLMVFLAGVVFISTWALLFSFIDSKNFRKTDRCIAVILILMICGFLLMYLTYTTEAGMAIATGLFLLFFVGMNKQKTKPSLIITGILLTLLGSLIRLEAIVMPLVVFLILGVFHINALANRRYLAAFGIAAFLVLIGAIVNNAIYATDPAWNDFISYSNAREQLYDTPRLANILASNDSKKLAPIGWSTNDAKMLGFRLIPDAKIYSVENFRYLTKEFPLPEQSVSAIWNSFSGFMQRKTIFSYLLLLLSTFLLLIAAQPKKMEIISTIIASLAVMGLLLYMTWGMKLVERVILPPVFTISLINLLFWCNNRRVDDRLEISHKNQEVPGILKLITGILILFCFVLNGAQDVSLSKVTATREDLYLKTISDVNALMQKGDIPQNSLFLGLGIPIEWSNPFILNLPSFHYIFMDWLTNSPVFEETMNKNGIQSLMSSLYQRNDIFLFGTPEQFLAVKQFILEHDHVDVFEKIIYTYTDPTGVYGTLSLYELISN
jgi:hypothetical protein